MKIDFNALNFETIDANVNATPDMFVNTNGLTFTRRVLEDMGYPQNVVCQIDVKNRVFAIRGCKSNELKAFKFSKPKEEQKPDAVTVISKGNYQDKVWSLPVSELLYVGPATTRKLMNMNVMTIGDLAHIKRNE